MRDQERKSPTFSLEGRGEEGGREREKKPLRTHQQENRFRRASSLSSQLSENLLFRNILIQIRAMEAAVLTECEW